VLTTIGRLLVVVSVVAGGLAGSASPAVAPFHLMEVQEVFAGTDSAAEADFVELEMLASGQNLVGGHVLRLYDASGTGADCTIPADVPNDANGDRILFATAQFESGFGIDADFTMPPLLHADGGAVCFEDIDCVTWGSFSGSTTSPAGTPFAGGINQGMSIDRVADTNQSADDFTQIDPTAQPNAGSLGAASCQAAPGGAGFALKGLKAKVKGGRATITGHIEPSAAGQKVKLVFFADGSPLRKVAAKSGTLNAESRFKKRFGVPSDSTRCKIAVRFLGSKLGRKRFRC
jgi:hypothetical protein